MFGFNEKSNIVKIWIEIVAGICLLALGFYLGKISKTKKVTKKQRGIELKDELMD